MPDSKDFPPHFLTLPNFRGYRKEAHVRLESDEFSSLTMKPTILSTGKWRTATPFPKQCRSMNMSQSASTRRKVFRLSGERRVVDIMKAAREVFSEKGYDEAALSDIAERADVVEESVYRYFENMRDLLVKVIEHWYKMMLTDYDQQLSGISGTRNRFRFMIWRHLATVHENPAICHLIFQILRTGSDYSPWSQQEIHASYTSAVCRKELRTANRGRTLHSVSCAI
jgi:AcrR family transcriptional regulator